MRRNPLGATGWLRLAVAHFWLGQDGESVAAFARARGLDPARDHDRYRDLEERARARLSPGG